MSFVPIPLPVPGLGAGGGQIPAPIDPSTTSEVAHFLASTIFALSVFFVFFRYLPVLIVDVVQRLATLKEKGGGHVAENTRKIWGATWSRGFEFWVALGRVLVGSAIWMIFAPTIGMTSERATGMLYAFFIGFSWAMAPAIQNMIAWMLLLVTGDYPGSGENHEEEGNDVYFSFTEPGDMYNEHTVLKVKRVKWMYVECMYYNPVIPRQPPPLGVGIGQETAKLGPSTPAMVRVPPGWFLTRPIRLYPEMRHPK